MEKNQEQNVERPAYGVREGATAIGVSSRTLHDYIRDGSIAHFRMGTRVLIPADELKAFIEQRTQRRNPDSASHTKIPGNSAGYNINSQSMKGELS